MEVLQSLAAEFRKNPSKIQRHATVRQIRAGGGRGCSILPEYILHLHASAADPVRLMKLRLREEEALGETGDRLRKQHSTRRGKKATHHKCDIKTSHLSILATYVVFVFQMHYRVKVHIYVCLSVPHLLPK